MEELTYVRVGGPPVDWRDVEVYFEGVWSGDWIEVNVTEGWGIRHLKNGEGHPFLAPDGKEAARETVTGDFRLRYRELAEI